MGAVTSSSGAKEGRRIAFVVTGSVAVGVGHIRRCLALALRLREKDFQCVFHTDPESVAMVPGLRDFDVMPRGEVRCAMAIIDGYEWTAREEAACRDWAEAVMVIDDLADRSHDCEILLDQTVGRLRKAYDGLVPLNCERLVGASYALLRAEFAAHRAVALARRDGRAARRALVGFGGTDPNGNSLVALDAIRRTGLAIQVDVVLGSRAPSRSSVEAACQDQSLNATLHLDSESVAELMTGADVAIGAAGVSALERCALGLPSIVVVDAANQEDIAQGLAKEGAAQVVGRSAEVTSDSIAEALHDLVRAPARMRAMAGAAATLCDGLGAQRVADILEKRLAA